MIRIFLADDHPMIQTALDSLFRGTGQAIVGQATSGPEALASIGSSDADVLVLDVQMPGMSGVQVLRELRKRGDSRPAVVLTAGITDDALREALALKANGIVLKTSDPSLLVDCIDVVSKGGVWLDPQISDRAAQVSQASPPRRTLTDRERELVRLVQQGLRNREIAERLNITEGTVKVYLHGIFDKLGVSTRTELATRADQLIGTEGE